MRNDNYRSILLEKELKITPQRIAVLEAVHELKNHPTAENVCDYIKKKHPNIAVGTIYKTLEAFVKKGIIRKVKTEKDFMRYDSILENHHHIYCSETEHIEDYFDKDLDTLIEKYFRKKKIPNFTVEYVKLHLVGKFNPTKNK